jgi:hypothetical protein
LPSFIGVELKKVSAFKDGIQYQFRKQFTGHDTLIDIYHCLRNAPTFVDRTDWNSSTTIDEIADWLFSEVKKAAGDNDWCIYMDFNSDRYVIKYFTEYPELEGLYTMPLEWLPDLQKWNVELYELTLCTLGRMILNHSISTGSQFEDMIVHELPLEESDDEEWNHWFEIDVAKYKHNGQWRQLLQFIFKYGREISEADCIKKINEYKPRSLKQRIHHNWLKLAIPILEQPFNLYRFNFNPDDPENNDGTPIIPSDYYSFVHSFYDKVFEKIEEWQNDTAGQLGVMAPYEVGEFNQNEHIQPEPIAPLKALKEFMKEGRAMYFQYYNLKYKNHYDSRRDDTSF